MDFSEKRLKYAMKIINGVLRPFCLRGDLYGKEENN